MRNNSSDVLQRAESGRGAEGRGGAELGGAEVDVAALDRCRPSAVGVVESAATLWKVSKRR